MSVADDRISALETEVAELRAFVPMLARLAYYETWSGRSVPEHVIVIETLLETNADRTVDAFRDGREAVDRWGEAEFVRTESLPRAAQEVQDAHEVRFREWLREPSEPVS